MSAAPTRSKVFFWIIWGVFSAYFAESLSASQPFAVLTPFNILVLVPLYGLHSILLATLVIRFGKPRLYTLFFAGAIFGLYEAYITKVLWNPPWGATWMLGGIEIISTAVLVLWWHVFMAFIIPLLALEEQTTASHLVASGLPPKFHKLLSERRNLYLLIAAAGVVQGSTGGPSAGLVLANLVSPLVLFLLVWLWRRKGNQHYRLEELLPDKKQFGWLALLLGLYYLALGLVMRPEELPGLLPQMMIWVLYGLFISLLLISMKRSSITRVEESSIPLVEMDRGLLLGLWGTLAVSSLLASLFPVREIFQILHWLLGIVFGVGVFFFATRDAYKVMRLSIQGENHG